MEDGRREVGDEGFLATWRMKDTSEGGVLFLCQRKRGDSM